MDTKGKSADSTYQAITRSLDPIADAIDPRKREQPIIIKRRRPRRDRGHGSHSWKVAYADFTTALMAFFLVLWILSLDDATRGEIETYFKDPTGSGLVVIGHTDLDAGGSALVSRVRMVELRQLGTLASDLEESLAELAALNEMEARVSVLLDERALRIELMETDQGGLFFSRGSSELRPEATEVLTHVANALSAVPHHVIVEGHTDATQYASTSRISNWELSSDRANSARRVLEDAGLELARISAVRGMADRELRLPDAPTDPANRRIAIVLPLITAGLAGDDDATDARVAHLGSTSDDI